MVSRAWCFTINNYTDDEETALSKLPAGARYLVVGTEVGESETTHLQGYIEMVKATRLNAMRILLGGRAHVEARRGTAEQAIQYCKKDGGFQEYGTPGQGRGARTDVQAVVAAVRAGKSRAEIIVDMPEFQARYRHFIGDYKAAYEEVTSKSFRRVWVCYIFGAPGIGKTSSVVRKFPDAFVSNAANSAFPLNNYDGQAVLCLDDFYGQLTCHEMLRLLDGYRYLVNVKGGHRYALWTTVFITANKPLDELYPLVEPTVKQALRRRVSALVYMCNEVAGNTEPPPGYDKLGAHEMSAWIDEKQAAFAA